jgi:hypothetical protein
MYRSAERPRLLPAPDGYRAWAQTVFRSPGSLAQNALLERPQEWGQTHAKRRLSELTVLVLQVLKVQHTPDAGPRAAQPARPAWRPASRTAGSPMWRVARPAWRPASRADWSPMWRVARPAWQPASRAAGFPMWREARPAWPLASRAGGFPTRQVAQSAWRAASPDVGFPMWRVARPA